MDSSTSSATAGAAPALTSSLSQETIDEIKTKGPAVLGAIVGIIGPDFKAALLAWEATHMTGLFGSLEKHVANDLLDQALASIGESALAV